MVINFLKSTILAPPPLGALCGRTTLATVLTE